MSNSPLMAPSFLRKETIVRLMVRPKPRTIFLLRLLQLNIYNRLVERLRSLDLTPIQYMVLSILSSRGAWSTAELARRFEIAPQSMTEIVALLENKKLIERSKSEAHGRILDIRLTASGTRALQKCDRAVDKIEREAFSEFSVEEIASFRELMSKALLKMRSSRLDAKQSRAARRMNGDLAAMR